MTPDIEGALSLFDLASTYVTRTDLLAEVEWHRRACLDNFSETDLLRETAWVVLCSGFRERTVRNVFDYISLCFCDWESAAAIVAAGPACRTAAMASFRNVPKLNSILRTAYLIHTIGFDALKQAVLKDPLTELRRFPHIGPITVCHLAKNLGLDVTKPDRHLARTASRFGFDSTDRLCMEIAKITGEQRKVVDLIVWRYLADNQ